MHRPLLSGMLALVLASAGCSDSNPSMSMPDADSMFGTDAGVDSGTSVPSPLQPIEACSTDHEPRELVDEFVRDSRAEFIPEGTYNARYVSAEDDILVFEDADGSGTTFILYPTLPLPLELGSTYELAHSSLGYAISDEGNFIAFVGSRDLGFRGIGTSGDLGDGLSGELELHCDRISSTVLCRELRIMFLDLTVMGVGRYGPGDHTLDANGKRYELSIRDLRGTSGSITGCNIIPPHSLWFTLKPLVE